MRHSASRPAHLKRADAMEAGCRLTSASSPALDGVYDIRPEALRRVRAIAARIAAGRGFPHAGGDLVWPDTSGAPHVFNAAQWAEFAAALDAYAIDLDAYEAAHHGGNFGAQLPTQPVTIA